MSFGSKQFIYASLSAVLGGWAFWKVNSVSGPAFEPILAACTNKDIPIAEFAAQTGYHAYEPMVGLGVFNVLVCLITQFLLELRQTPPAGVLVWGGVILVSLPSAILCMVEAGRPKAKGPIRYPVILGLSYQLFGISVMFPLVWVPSYIFGKGNGPVSTTRGWTSIVLALPGVISTAIVFLADTDSYLWTVTAGILGGPILALSGLVLWNDKPLQLSSSSKEANLTVKNSASIVAKGYYITAAFGLLGWCILVHISFVHYGTDLTALWDAIWTSANASVKFMTIDTIVFYLGIMIYLASRDETSAIKAMVLTPVLGPATACSLVMASLEKQNAVVPVASPIKKMV